MTIFVSGCVNSQNNKENKPKLIDTCEGCEAIFEYGNKPLRAIDTLPGFFSTSIPIKISGTIFLQDGVTPAKDVILYVYHTDEKGLYSKKEGATGWAIRHGFNRGWVKTAADGKYCFYTMKPAPYPKSTISAHIHPTILEPNGKYYWLEDYYFEGDSFLTDKEINPTLPKGGTMGVLKLTKEGNNFVATRNFILGKNIPNYN